MPAKRLPRLERASVDTHQRERLARWLQEWQLARDLAPDHTRMAEGQVTAEPAEWNPSLTADVPVETGHVRLLYPRNRATWSVPVYIALLGEAGPDSFLAAPFGRFAEPATPSELLTQRSVPPLRVLCLWNARTISRRRADQSWLTAELSPEEIADAITVHESGRGGAPRPSLAQRVGPPLMHPDDPRHVYLRRERLRFDCACREEGVAYPLPDATDLPLAAENREPYDNKHTESPDESDDRPTG